MVQTGARPKLLRQQYVSHHPGKLRSPGTQQLARAEIYAGYKLYNEVASEYEEALKVSPESVELLMATASAQDRAGNFKRRDEIDEQIKILKK